MDGRGVDEWRDSYGLAGGWDVTAIEERAGLVLDGVIVRNFGVPVSLAAVESNTAARCHSAASYGLAAAEKAMFEVFYSGCYT